MICPPVWLCRCGCGGVTPISQYTNRKRFIVKGEHTRFIKGHRKSTHSGLGGEPPLCACGCGERTRMSTKTSTRDGSVKGRYNRFLPYHHLKVMEPTTGADHWRWKGGLTSKSRQERNDPKTREWRKAIYARDNYTCWDCGKRGTKLNAHHLKPWASYPELRFVLTNGITVCADPCHKIRTKRG